MVQGFMERAMCGRCEQFAADVDSLTHIEVILSHMAVGQKQGTLADHENGRNRLPGRSTYQGLGLRVLTHSHMRFVESQKSHHPIRTRSVNI